MAMTREQLDAAIAAHSAAREAVVPNLDDGNVEELVVPAADLARLVASFRHDVYTAADEIIDYLQNEAFEDTDYDLREAHRYARDWDGSDDEGYPFDALLLRLGDPLWVILLYSWRYEGGRQYSDGCRALPFGSEIAARAAFAGIRAVNTTWRLMELESGGEEAAA